MTSDNQAQIVYESLKERLDFSQEQRNWQNKISSLLRVVDEIFIEGFRGSHPQLADIDKIFNEGTIDDLKHLYNALVRYGDF